MEYNLNRLILKYLNFFALSLISIAYFSTITFYSSFTFYKEIFAVFGLLIFLIILFFQNTIILNNKIFFSFILIFIPLIQYCFGLIFFLQDAFLCSVYIAIFLLSIFVGFNFKVSTQFDLLTPFIFMLLFVGCVFVIMALNQNFIWMKSDLLFLSPYPNRATANLAQPNQLSTFLIMTLFSLFYLYKIKKINKVVMYFGIVFLLLGVVLTQSRSAWVSSVVLTALYLYYSHTKKDILNVIKLNSVFISLSLIISFLINIFTHYQSQTVINRLQDGSTRFKIWAQLIQSLLDKPWSGYGWGQVSLAQLSSMTSESTQGAWFTYSHNLFLDIMIWNGVLFGMVINIFILYTLYYCYINLASKKDLMLFLGFMAFFIHSCLEYPYAYTYFLIPSGIFLGYLLYQKNVTIV